MPKTYTHLNVEERDMLAVLKSQGRSLQYIAKALNGSPSTLCRELERNAPPINAGYYLPHKAQERVDKRNRISHQRKRLKSDLIRCYVQTHIALGWSPELIAGRLTREHTGLCLSHEAIYQLIYQDAPSLIPLLVRGHHRRKH